MCTDTLELGPDPVDITKYLSRLLLAMFYHGTKEDQQMKSDCEIMSSLP
jgi:hypothetical protein